MYKNTAGEKKYGESKIPKFPAGKEKSSKTFAEKKATQRCQTNVALPSEKAKKPPATSVQNVKRMSVVQISKDVMNHLQTENLNSEDRPENSIPTLVQDKDNASKRAPSKEKSSQLSQKSSGSLPRKQSTLDSKKFNSHCGMKFFAKKRNYQKPDRFQQLKEEFERRIDGQDIQTTEPYPEGIKNDPDETIVRKDTERLNIRNLENSPTIEEESPKGVSVIPDENIIKNCMEYHCLKFEPRWQSTPLKPDLFENINGEPNHYDSSVEWLKNTPMFSKALVKEKADKKTVGAKEAEHLPTASPAINETDIKICTAFTGMHLKYKRKGTIEKKDIFENVLKESQKDNQDRKPSGTSTVSTKMPSKAANPITKPQHLRVEKLKQTSTQTTGKSETTTVSTKKVVSKPIPTFTGLRFNPKQKRLRDTFAAQKAKSESDCKVEK